MKKPKTADVVMVLIIALILVGGVLLALHLTAEEEIPFGTAYRITPIPGDVLPSEEGGTNRCTLTIRCDTILKNADSLVESKIPYVPEDGTILGEITVEFKEGETAFDVLKRACEAADIQLEYSWTPLYDSYYVEGINHLYEFDCGHESGWMYDVNEGFPNYGSSAYELQDGDRIRWQYTCSGLGTDVGAPANGMK